VNRSGWTVGGGLEWMFAPGLSVFGEFNYMDFGSRNVNFVKAPGTVPTDVRTFFAPGSRSSSSWWA
jgi:outer membrane immunogenic protein